MNTPAAQTSRTLDSGARPQTRQRALAAFLVVAMAASACGGDSADEAAGLAAQPQDAEESLVEQGGDGDGVVGDDTGDGDGDGDGEMSEGDSSEDDSSGGEESLGGEMSDESGDDNSLATTASRTPVQADAEAALAPAANREYSASQQFDSDESFVEQVTPNDAAGSANGGLFPDEAEAPPQPERPQVRSFVDASVDAQSTFALDVDTGSYTLARRALKEGRLPDPNTVRPEEFLNALDYRYSDPNDELGIFVDGGPSPFQAGNVLLRVGIQGERVAAEDRPDAALTFIIDTSGSMVLPTRLQLVKDSLIGLVDQLQPSDRVAIVTYEGDSTVVLESTSVRNRFEIIDAINSLRTGGSTNLDAGLRTGYDLARSSMIDNGINRVILASDGIANVGLTDPDGLSEMIRDDADAGIQLVTIGVDMDNVGDNLMEQIADQGDGFYAYIDGPEEADRLFREELVSTLLTIAIDAKVQVEFDPAVVDSYRLIGFENRAVRDSDFRNDDVDAGEIGAGHTVTAIYELDLAPDVEPTDRLGEVNLRWERPDGGDVVEIDRDIEAAWIAENFGDTNEAFQLATTAVAFAELLRNSPYADNLEMDQVAAEAERLANNLGDETSAEFAELARLAARLR